MLDKKVDNKTPFSRSGFSANVFLSLKEEKELYRKFSEEQCRSSWEKLILSHEPLVIRLAVKYKSSVIDEADLIQQGMLGLHYALDNFSPGKGVRFNSFARHYVRSEILEHLVSNSSIVKKATTKPQRKLFFNSSMLEKNMSSQKAQDVADTLNVKVSDVLEMNDRLNAKEDSISQDDYFSEELIDDGGNVADILARESEFLYRRECLADAMSALSDKEKDIVASRWLKEDKVALKTLAVRHGLSLEGVRIVEKRAISNLRKQMLN